MVFFADTNANSRWSSLLGFIVFMICILGMSWKYYEKAPSFSKNRENYRIPKTIWTYHRKESPTPLQSWCMESWHRHHPDFQIRILTPTTWKGYVRIVDPDTEAPLLRDQDRWEEALELHVLEEHGGVWLDAHVYLRECLEDWLFPRHAECSGFQYTSEEYTKKQQQQQHIPLMDKRCLASEKRNPLIQQWRDEYMRLLSFSSIEAYLQSIYTSTPLNVFTFPVDWIMPLSLQHVLLKRPYPMESVILHSSEEGPLRHEIQGRGDQKKADEIGKQSAERIVFFKD